MQTAQLNAGVARVDITPPVGLPMAGYGSRDRLSEGTLDPLTATALVLEQGPESCAIVAADLIGVSARIARAVRRRVAALCPLPPERVLVCATHTHWGPALEPEAYLAAALRESVSPAYAAGVALRLAGAVAQAWRRREPAVALAGTGEADLVAFNRRPVGPDGKVVMSLTMAPPQALAAAAEGARLAHTWRKGSRGGRRLGEPMPLLDGLRPGVTDPSVPVLRLTRPDGSPLAAVLAFASHAVCGAGPETFYHISPDWPGCARTVPERLLGCPAMVLAGPCGDQVPRVRGGDARERIGFSVGAEAVRVWELLDGPGAGPLAVARRHVRVPVRPLPTVAEAEAALAARPDPEGPGAAAERNLLDLARTFGRRRAMTCEIWAMGIGTQWGLVGLPGELFAEIGLQIRRQSPFEHTAVVELALDCPGYFPTDAARAEGGYEPTWSPAGDGAEKALVRGALAALRAAAARTRP